MTGSRIVESGDADVVLVGGVESMTRAPWVLPKPSRAFPAGNVTAVSTTLGWRLVNDRMPTEWTVSLGEANELLAERFGISRERQDEFAVRSHTLAARGLGGGVLRRPRRAGARRRPRPRRGHPGRTRRSRSSPALKPSFRADGTITAGNASPLNDGASALLLGSESAASDDSGARPARPDRGPGHPRAGAAELRVRARSRPPRRRWRRAGIGWADVAAVELNEAFAAQSLACVDAWKVSTRRSSTPRAARSPSATRWAPPAAASSARSPTGSASPATGGASRRSASASARRWPSSRERDS